MTAYALLMSAAVWHSLALGTIGTRGRVVHVLTGAGLIAGLLGGPAGYAGIGGAVATVALMRWAATEHGRAVLGELLRAGVRAFVRWAADTVRHGLDAVLYVFSPPPTYEAAPVERVEAVSPPADTAEVALPHGDRWGLLAPSPEGAGPGAVPSVTPLPTYDELLRRQAPKSDGFNAAAREAESRFGVSRSKFARDLREIRERRAA